MSHDNRAGTVAFTRLAGSDGACARHAALSAEAESEDTDAQGHQGRRGSKQHPSRAMVVF
ncbi:MAG TPA: hypothetical protein VMG12_19955 [Polyangiaceae bacterium]|nr:hypothetical protein [Polyangiaceae bacterium]